MVNIFLNTTVARPEVPKRRVPWSYMTEHVRGRRRAIEIDWVRFYPINFFLLDCLALLTALINEVCERDLRGKNRKACFRLQ